MARVNHAIERGLRIYAENSQTSFVDYLFGSAAPGSAAIENDASVGSIYTRTTDGSVYRKITAGSGTDKWEKIPDFSDLSSISWRARVKAATGQAAPSFPATIDLVVNPFSDDQAPTLVAADFAVNDFIIFGVGGTPVLAQVTAISGDEITVAAASPVLATGDNFIVENYLPDTPDSQEDYALVHYNGSAILKVSDINWNFADGITLNGYTESQGPISGSDTVQVAIQKTGGDVTDLVALTGVTRGDVNFGTFTGLSLADSQTAKQLFQRIETLLEQMRGVQVTGITTAATVDSVPHASVKACKWLVEAFEEATPANRQALEVYAVTNGTNVDDTVYAKLKTGSNFNLSISVDISGGDMRLRAASTSGGVTVTARRIEVVQSVL